jgi:hypothetical protein
VDQAAIDQALKAFVLRYGGDVWVGEGRCPMPPTVAEEASRLGLLRISDNGAGGTMDRYTMTRKGKRYLGMPVPPTLAERILVALRMSLRRK